ncbi:MAG: trehalose-phosphatase [Actinomycetota bacterium]
MALDPAWSPLVRAGARAGLLVDFDGSLAPIVDEPESARPLPAAVDACSRLAARLGLVAVVSGRPVAFVSRHLPDPAVAVVGQYGLERERDGAVVADPRALAYVDAIAAAATEAQDRWPALTIERKGRVAVTVHWRTAPGAAPEPAALAALARAHDLTPVPGRMACELRPPLPVDKGTAVAELLVAGDLVAVAFVGDDHGDLAAYSAVREWARSASGRTALCVAVESDESPPGLLDAADITVAGPPVLAGQLVALATAIS